jgi:hypothetical protein
MMDPYVVNAFMLIMIAAVLALMLAVIPEEKPRKPPFGGNSL